MPALNVQESGPCSPAAAESLGSSVAVGRGSRVGPAGQGRPPRPAQPSGSSRSTHFCRACSSGGRSQPVYTPLVTLYSSKAPKQGSC